MTNEKAVKILTRIMNNNFYGGDVQMACKMGIEALSKPSLPSNLDEAAEKFARLYDNGTCDGIAQECFKASAEWMAGQFQRVNGDLIDWHSTSDGKEFCSGIMTCECFEVPEGFYIRKKQ